MIARLFPLVAKLPPRNALGRCLSSAAVSRPSQAWSFTTALQESAAARAESSLATSAQASSLLGASLHARLGLYEAEPALISHRQGVSLLTGHSSLFENAQQLDIDGAHEAVETLEDVLEESAGIPLEAMNRNAREGKKANHGKRPCSNRRRKRKARARSNDHPFLSVKKKKGYDM